MWVHRRITPILKPTDQTFYPLNYRGGFPTDRLSFLNNYISKKNWTRNSNSSKTGLQRILCSYARLMVDTRNYSKIVRTLFAVGRVVPYYRSLYSSLLYNEFVFLAESRVIKPIHICDKLISPIGFETIKQT